MTRSDVVVVTSIENDHLQQFKSVEITWKEKSRILESMTPEELVILNGDEPNVLWMRKQTEGQIITCGFSESNEIRASEVELHFPPAMSFRVSEEASRFTVRTWLIEHTMLFPLLTAYAVARSESIDSDKIVRRLEELKPRERRMEVLPLPNGARVLVEGCKSLPETIDSALRTLTEIPALRRIVVMREVGGLVGGPRDIDSFCCRYGMTLGQVADVLVHLAKDPQQKAALKNGVAESGFHQEDLEVKQHFEETVDYLQETLKPKDLVLFKDRFSERLVRIVLALQGQDVSCWVTDCEHRMLFCRRCPNLARSGCESEEEIQPVHLFENAFGGQPSKLRCFQTLGWVEQVRHLPPGGT
jgi:UDP-N-acetylmuramoyl-tripeptide--D-alanyl-D-alanine ligase